MYQKILKGITPNTNAGYTVNCIWAVKETQYIWWTHLNQQNWCMIKINEKTLIMNVNMIVLNLYIFQQEHSSCWCGGSYVVLF